MSWYRGSLQLSASASATPRYLHEVDLAAAAGNVTITAPATGIDPLYFGVVNASTVANGAKVIIIQTSGAVEICRLSAAGESVWVGRNPATGAWEQLAHDNPSEYQWTWANATERLATLASAAQVGKVGYQTDFACPFNLLGLGTPNRWGQLGDPSTTVVATAKVNSGATTFQSVGLGFSNNAGTAQNRTPTTTNNATTKSRFAIGSAAAINSAMLLRSGTTGGFLPAGGFRIGMSIVLGTTSANMKWGVGHINQANVNIITNVNYLALADAIFVGRPAGTEANLQVWHANAAGVATTIDLGASFPALNAANPNGYEWQLYTVNGAAYTYLVRNMVTGAERSGTINTNIPLSSIALGYLWMGNTNTDTTGLFIDPVDMYVGQLNR